MRRNSVVIDYGNGVVREFSAQTISHLRRFLKVPRLGKRRLREATRAWVESMPERFDFSGIYCSDGSAMQEKTGYEGDA